MSFNSNGENDNFNEQNSSKTIDFSKFDSSIIKLVYSIRDYTRKQNEKELLMSKMFNDATSMLSRSRNVKTRKNRKIQKMDMDKIRDAIFEAIELKKKQN